MRAFGALAALILALAVPAHAQTDPSPEAVAEAREHFERGVELFNEGRNDAALAEFQRAYDLAPAPPVLYNIARVHEALGHAVEAADAYARYLEEGGDSLSRRRRHEATAALERQRARIAFVTVTTNVEGATVSVDGIDVAETPLSEPIRLAAGEHTVGVRAAGYDSARRAVQVAGGDELTLDLEIDAIVSAQGTLRVEANVPGVAIRLDGQLLGETPLDATVPVPTGEHTIVAERPGYERREERFDLAGGAERIVRFEMEPDEDAPASVLGQLELRLPRGPSVVRIDGEPALLRSGGITLPAGVHRLQLEVAEREPYETEVHVPADDEVALTPPLRWTPEARAERVAAAGRTRTWGMVMTIGGGALLLGGVGVLGWNEGRISDTDRRIVEINEEFEAAGCEGAPSDRCDDLREQGAQLTERQDREQRTRWIATSMLGVGALLGIIGVVLWTVPPTEAEIDHDAHMSAPMLRLRARIGGLTLDGRF
jgi:hypothetical protein